MRQASVELLTANSASPKATVDDHLEPPRPLREAMRVPRPPRAFGGLLNAGEKRFRVARRPRKVKARLVAPKRPRKPVLASTTRRRRGSLEAGASLGREVENGGQDARNQPKWRVRTRDRTEPGVGACARRRALGGARAVRPRAARRHVYAPCPSRRCSPPPWLRRLRRVFRSAPGLRTSNHAGQAAHRRSPRALARARPRPR